MGTDTILKDASIQYTKTVDLEPGQYAVAMEAFIAGALWQENRVIKWVSRPLIPTETDPKVKEGEWKFKGAVCRGSYLLDSACGRCERCEEELSKMQLRTVEHFTEKRALQAVSEDAPDNAS